MQQLELFGFTDTQHPLVSAVIQYSDAEWAAILASGNALELLMCLLLARWWQAQLYNPGGFKTEFHHLRFSRIQALSLVALILICNLMGTSWQPWVIVLALPLLVAGIALVHWLVATRQLVLQTLILFYVGLVVVMPLFVPVLVVIGFTDSLVDLRHYLKGKTH